MADSWENLLIKTLKDYPQFTPPSSFSHIKSLADKIIDRGVKMGEGWLLPGEAAELIEKGYGNIICAQPFGCLPNHIVGKGTIRRLRELYKDANIFPIDYDAGASKVNQENRIKLMLSMANENSKKQKDTTKNQQESKVESPAESTDNSTDSSDLTDSTDWAGKQNKNEKEKQKVKVGGAK